MLIFHPKRYDRVRDRWFFSPHFHVLGYVRNGFVDGRLVKLVHDASGYVLRNFERRKSVIGTVLYQLSHAGVPSGGRHGLNWFGELKFSAKVNGDLLRVQRQNEVDNKAASKLKRVCPVCGGVMVHVCRVANSGQFDYKLYEDCFVLDRVDDWVVVPDEYHPHRRRKFSESEEDAWRDYDASVK